MISEKKIKICSTWNVEHIIFRRVKEIMSEKVSL